MSGMRVFGLGSGMDIDQMVSDMMKVERQRRVTKLDQQKQISLWQQELYQEMNKDVASFIVDMKKEFGLSGSTASGTLYNKSADSFTWVRSAASSDETKLTANATSKAINGSYSVDVDQLAENVSKASTGAITTGTAGTLIQQFGNVFDSDGTGTTDDGKLRFTLKTNLTDAAGKEFVFDPSVDTINNIVKEINDSNIGISAAYDSDLDRFFLNTSSTGSDKYFQVLSDEESFLSGAAGDGTDNKLKLNLKGYDAFSNSIIGANLTDNLKTIFGGADGSAIPDNFSFTIETIEGAQTFNIDTNNMNMNDLLEALNAEGTGLEASYNETTDKFYLNSKFSPDGSWIKVTSDTSNFLSGPSGDGSDNKLSLNLKNDGTQANSNFYNGKDLIFDFGDATDLRKSSNTFSVNGINMTAKNIGIATVTVDTDVDGVYEKVSKFVEKYNDLIAKLNGELSEKVYRDFKPLSDEEKEAMTEDQIKKWEEKAKSGLLKNDNLYSRMVSDMRQGLYASVSGASDAMNQLTAIGIETGTYSEKGKLVIDETKLKDAIINNASGVIDLLFKEPSVGFNKDDDDLTEAQRKQKYNESGLVHRMFNTMVNGLKTVIDKAGPGDDSQLLRNVRSNILVDFTTGKNLESGSISMLDESILDYEKNIYNQEELLARIENRYYSQFSAMETALNRMNQQSSWLASQLGGM